MRRRKHINAGEHRTETGKIRDNQMKDSADISVEFASFVTSDIDNVLKLFEAEAADPNTSIASTIKKDMSIERMFVTTDMDSSTVTLRCKTEYMLNKQELDAYYTKMKSRVLDALDGNHIHGQGRLLIKTSRTDTKSEDGRFSGKMHYVGKSI